MRRTFVLLLRFFSSNVNSINFFFSFFLNSHLAKSFIVCKKIYEIKIFFKRMWKKWLARLLMIWMQNNLSAFSQKKNMAVAYSYSESKSYLSWKVLCKYYTYYIGRKLNKNLFETIAMSLYFFIFPTLLCIALCVIFKLQFLWK